MQIQIFPRLRAGTFIEAEARLEKLVLYDPDFPAFGRGLSLRQKHLEAASEQARAFPRLRAGTFIEAGIPCLHSPIAPRFPRLRAGTFIEAPNQYPHPAGGVISPPSGGDFH